MIKYCQHEFLPIWASLKRKIEVFSEDNSLTRPFQLKKKKKLLVLVIYDNSIFSANNKKKDIQKKRSHFYH